MSEVIESQEGIFEFAIPQRINAEKWLSDHLDCNAIIDDLGNDFIVYAFTCNPKYNYALKKYKNTKNYAKQYLLRGISSDGLNGLF